MYIYIQNTFTYTLLLLPLLLLSSTSSSSKRKENIIITNMCSRIPSLFFAEQHTEKCICTFDVHHDPVFERPDHRNKSSYHAHHGRERSDGALRGSTAAA